MSTAQRIVIGEVRDVLLAVARNDFRSADLTVGGEAVVFAPPHHAVVAGLVA